MNDRDVPARITDYLFSGGMWNPELAKHERVRDLLIDARDVIEILLRDRASCIKCCESDRKVEHGK